MTTIKNIAFTLFVSTLSCTNSEPPEVPFERFVNVIEDCDNKGNPDINCINYIVFDEGEMASIYLENRKQLDRYSYIWQNDTITFTFVLNPDHKLTFIPLGTDTLKRVIDESLWIKKIWNR